MKKSGESGAELPDAKLKKTKRKKSGKTMKLSVRMSILLGLLAFFGMSIVNFGTLRLTRLSFTKAMDRYMEDKGKASGEELAAIISKMEGVSSIMESGIQETGNKLAPSWTILDLEQEKQAIIPMKESSFRSRVVNHAISSSQYNAESVLIGSLYGVMASNENLVGAGVFFEPNAFFEGVEDYAPYIGREGFQNRSITNYPYSQFQDKPYYTEAKEKKKTIITDVYETVLDKKKVITISRPVLFRDRFVGAILLDIDMNLFSAAEQKDSHYPSLETDIVDERGNFAFSKDTELIGTPLSKDKTEKDYQKISAEMGKGNAFHLLEREKDGVERRVYYVPTDIMGNTWWIMLSVDEQDFMAPIFRIVFLCFGLATVGIAVIILGIYLLTKKSLAPLEAIARVGRKVSNGDFSEKVAYLKNDEIGYIGQGFQQVMDTIKGISEDLKEKLGELSEGNFRVNLEEDKLYQGEYYPLIESLRNIRNELNSTILEIQKSASEVSATSSLVSNGAQSLSQGATEQASSVEELSAGMNEISDSIKLTTKKAEEAKRLSRDAGQAVTLSTGKMEEMSRAMEEITEKSNEIGKIIKTIDDIAFQTNILSLNAAIEAARAGAAGKGFAVVADEVGNLAQKSAKAAQNTGILIEETKEAVERGAKITKETEEALSTVAEHADRINNMVFEISKESERESQGMGQLTVGMEQISSVVQTNSATAEESAAASEELSGQAVILDDLVAKFRLQE